MSEIDFSHINAASLPVLEVLCQRWLPNGYREGREYVVGSLKGEAGRSLKICLHGPKAGVWRDFATGEGGSDPISLAAAIFNLRQFKAARQIAEMLGVDQ